MNDESTPHDDAPDEAPEPVAFESDGDRETPGSNLESDSSGSGYRVSLPAFEGPLDLLLHLIRQHKLDIYDIPIVLITEQYNRYLDAMEQLDLEVAADYIYIAALLIHIKSKMLLPRDESEVESGDDPRAELVDRLIEYQRFKSVAETFAELDVVRMGVWSRPPTPDPGGTAEPTEIDMSEVSLFDLIDAFRTALVRYKRSHPQAIELKRSVHKVSDKMLEMMRALDERSPMRLLWFLEGRDRGELVAIFLAILELVRLGALKLSQSENFGDVELRKSEKEIDYAQLARYDN